MGRENIIMISNAQAFKPYGHLGARASLRRSHSMDASLQIRRLLLDDGGKYRCELVNGIEDESVVITLRIEGNQSSMETIGSQRWRWICVTHAAILAWETATDAHSVSAVLAALAISSASSAAKVVDRSTSVTTELDSSAMLFAAADA